jgi:hypothetical protein
MAGSSTTLVDHGSVRAAASLREDGTPYRFEMVHASGTFRTYADEPAELVAALIPGYPGERDPVAAAAARIRHAVHVQVVAQAAINVELGTESCTSEQRAVLCGNRSAPPVPTCWTAPVPLVLVDCFYAPITALPRPVAEAPGELLWIRTSTDWDHLRSLADLGVVVLSEHRSATATPRPAPGV